MLWVHGMEIKGRKGEGLKIGKGKGNRKVKVGNGKDQEWKRGTGSEKGGKVKSGECGRGREDFKGIF